MPLPSQNALSLLEGLLKPEQGAAKGGPEANLQNEEIKFLQYTPCRIPWG